MLHHTCSRYDSSWDGMQYIITVRCGLRAGYIDVSQCWVVAYASDINVHGGLSSSVKKPRKFGPGGLFWRSMGPGSWCRLDCGEYSFDS